jgi:hypothetical protein
VGDFNGDGRADIASFSRGTSKDVFVALSSGSTFGARVKWHESFAGVAAVPGTGDFNGDGWADVVAFDRGSSPFVSVSLSLSTTFFGTFRWHDFFAANAEIPGPASLW